jgi:hypothetical protein
MFKYLSIISLLFVNSVFASEFRHTGIKSKKQDYYYLGIGLIFPFANKTTDFSSFKVKVNPDSEIGVAFTDSKFKLKDVTSGEMTFPAQKIGGSAFLGYKTKSPLRYDFKIDFLTFTKLFQVQRHLNDGYLGDIKLTVRQLAFMGNLYLDLDNSTSFTPYVGAGGGFSFTQATFIYELDNAVFQEPDSSLTDRANFLYELKAGIKIGSNKAYVDFEGFYRKTPQLKLNTKGVILKVGFRI